MLSAKIKISQVNNLTDARYFSAWGVDFLGFDINPNSPSFVAPPVLKEIADWIEGPAIVLECFEMEDPLWLKNYTDLMDEVLIERQLQGKNGVFVLIGETLNDKRIITYRSELAWSSISKSIIASYVQEYDEVYLDIPFNISEIDMILDAGISGFVVRGGHEEKIGFKSYDDLDQLFEVLSA